jgi:hypothetical protein
VTNLRWILLLAALLPAQRSGAVVVYDNTAADTGFGATFTTEPSTELGDQILLDGTERLAQTASVFFFNSVDIAGMFDATLRFYEVASPVGPQIGGSFTVNDIAIDGLGEAFIDFTLGGLLLPDEVIFTLSVDQPMGLDVGLTVFDPPAIGSSDEAFFIEHDGVSFNQVTFGPIPPGPPSNLYFKLDATAIPEAITWPIASVVLEFAGLFQWFKSRRRVTTD